MWPGRQSAFLPVGSRARSGRRDQDRRGTTAGSASIRQVAECVSGALLGQDRLFQPAHRQATHQPVNPAGATQAQNGRDPVATSSCQRNRQHARPRHHRAGRWPDTVGIGDRPSAKADAGRGPHMQRRPCSQPSDHALTTHMPDDRRSCGAPQQCTRYNQAGSQVRLQPTRH